ncbi:MAG: helix-turn-helix domain-containing protein, partial [Gemmatimonadota bacterium]|nr:helix-turn-helix domain-containing protein [Gemmatimonadota bacterium]
YEVERGNFRRDLYYRLKVLSIQIPSLRERREDIPLLLNYFIEQFCRENNKTFAGIDDDALDIMKNYDWPGNVRELRNLAESMVVLSLGSRIRARDVPETIFRRGSPERLLPVRFGGAGETPRGEPGPGIDSIELLRLLYQAVSSLQKEMREIKQMFSGPDPRPVREHASAAARETEPGAPFPSAETHPGGKLPDRDISEYSSVQFEEAVEEGLYQAQHSMQEIERKALARTLASVGGNRRKAAKILGIGERTLYRKIKEYGI